MKADKNDNNHSKKNQDFISSKMKSYFYRPLLSDEQLESLHVYKYSAEDRSITYRYLLSPFYTKLVTYLPIWLAPNLITLLGFIFPLLSHALLMYECPTLLMSPTLEFDISVRLKCLHIFTGVSLLFYMIMDNLDGKQARRTNSSSPLGHLFDHGCDILNVTVSGLSFLICMQLKDMYMNFSALYNVGYLLFYTAILEEYHTGSMILREINGPNEGLLFLALVHFITAFKSYSFWSNTMVPFIELPLNKCLYWFSFFPTFHTIYGNFYGIIQHYKHSSKRQKQKSKKEIFKLMFINLKLQMLPIVLFIVIQLFISITLPDETRKSSIVLFWISGLLLFDYITKMMLSTVTNSTFFFFSWLFAPFIIAFASLLLFNYSISISIIYCCFFISLLYCSWRSYCIIYQITKFLNIQCFSIPVIPL